MAHVHEVIVATGRTSFQADIKWPCETKTDMVVYVGYMRPFNAESGEVDPDDFQTVAFKYAEGEQLIKRLLVEEHVYRTKLEHLQRVHVPMCVGLFRGQTGGTPIGVLILGHVEHELPCPLRELPRNLRCVASRTLQECDLH